MRALLVLLCFGLLFVPPLSAQVKVTSNEALEGRINQVGEKNEWKIELKEDGILRFAFSSNQMQQADIYLLRDDGVRVLLKGVGGTGRFNRTTTNQASWAMTTQGVLDVVVESELELQRGVYRLFIASRRNYLGAYTLTIEEPKFSAAATPMPPKKATPAGSSTLVVGPTTTAPAPGDIASELAAIKRELQMLREEIKMLRERK